MFFLRFLHFTKDLLVTSILWFYFMFGYLFIALFLYIPAYVFAENRATAFQNINHVHLKWFFALSRRLAPLTHYDISEEVRGIHSSVIVCNHISYLDPILLISLFQRQRTIVKHTFFQVPIFGWFLKSAGYISSGASEMLGPAMINNLEEIKEHLAAGGNLFVFPEGKRSRDGNLAPFNKGVFTIARYCNAPLKLIFISGTNKLFPPGHFLFNTAEAHRIRLALVGSLEPDYKAVNFSISAVADQARKIYEDVIEKIQSKESNNIKEAYR